MSFKIITKKENPVLKRFEIKGELLFSGVTPSNVQAKKLVADSMKAPEDAVAVRQILVDFGTTKANVFAHVYGSKADLDAVEPKLKQKKAKKEGEAAPEAKK